MIRLVIVQKLGFNTSEILKGEWDPTKLKWIIYKMVKVCSTKLMRLTGVTYDIKEVNEILLYIVAKRLSLLKH